MAKEKRALEQWEIDLIMEQRALMTLGDCWRIWVTVTEQVMTEQRDYLDEKLADCIGECLKQVKGLLYYGADYHKNRGKYEVPSITKFLTDVNAEIEATQAGKPTKKGAPNGDTFTPPTPRGMPPPPDEKR